MEFRLLGPLEMCQGETAVALGGHRERAVLAALLLHANSLATFGYLAGAIWETPPVAPESNIRTYVAGLRRRFRAAGEPGSRLATRPGGYLLAVRPGELDVEVFRDLAERGEHALRDGDFAAAAGHLSRALDLWRGEPLAGTRDPGVTLRAELTALTDLRLAVVEQHAQARIGLGRADTVIGELRALLAEYPLREELWAQLMLALFHSGRQAEALDVFAWARRLLVDELGVEPGPRLQRVHHEILSGGAEEPAPVAISAHRQLPMDIAEFTGREAELRWLHDLVANGRTETAVVISTIEGMAGVGKTRLAVHAAHQLTATGRFDDVQLWTDLRGFDPDQPPVEPTAALDGFLRLLGVPVQRIPPGLEARAALYRDRLAGKNALILLDNAATESQVRPLLPGSAGCLVLVTSRHSLSGLEGAHPLPLDVLTSGEAVDLLARVAGRERVAGEDEACARVAERCGHLPLAVALAARRLHNRPMWTVKDLADRLENEEHRLDHLPVRAIFDLSYRALAPEQRRMVRLLGLHPGDDFAADSAGALAETTPRHAETLLETLVDEHLLEQTSAGRYRFHDLVRAYARERVRADEKDTHRRLALDRLLTWYLHGADVARRVLAPHHRRQAWLRPLRGDVVVPEFPGYEQALEWCEAEHANFSAIVRTAAELVDDPARHVAWQLPSVLLTFYYLRSHWSDWIGTHRLALGTTSALGERHGHALILRGLGVAYSDVRRFDEAIDCHRRAQTIFDEVGDRNGKAWNLNNLGVVHVDLNQLAAASGCFEEALALFRETGDRQGEGICLNNLGDTERRNNRPERAIGHLEQALTVQRDLDDQAGLRFILATLADIHRDAGQHERAIRWYSEALEAGRALRDHRTVARTLASLGHTFAAAGDSAAAIDHWRHALEIFSELGDPQADTIRALLRDI